jgi:tetratricopeptide (TPR) repeat protein
MMNFGISPVQFQKELNNIVRQTYLGLFNQERLSARASIVDTLGGLVRMARYRLKFIYHDALFHKYAALSANDYDIRAKGGQYLDALTLYIDAFEAYPDRALLYLDRAQQYEVALIPAARGSYLFQRGKLLGDETLLNEAFHLYDKVWERDLYAENCVEVYKLLRKHGRRERAFTAAEALYELNPGAMRQAYIRLPVVFDVRTGDERLDRRVRSLLGDAGFVDVGARGGARWTLSVLPAGEGRLMAALVERSSGRPAARFTGNLPTQKPFDIALWVNNAARALFTPRR